MNVKRGGKNFLQHEEIIFLSSLTYTFIAGYWNLRKHLGCSNESDVIVLHVSHSSQMTKALGSNGMKRSELITDLPG